MGNVLYKIIESLSLEYYALFIINLDEDTISPYMFGEGIAESLNYNVEPNQKYSEWFTEYCNNFIAPDDREKVFSLFNIDILKARLEEKVGDFSISCRRIFPDEERYIELRVSKLNDSSNELVIAARNINEEVKSQILQKEAIQNALTLAEHASEAKTTFLTNISHDFRTPLNSIMGFANIAKSNLDDPDKVKNCLHKILSSSEHLLDLINEILDVSRIESGKMVIEEEGLNIRDLLDVTYSLFQSQAVDKGLVFTLDTSKLEHVYIYGDQLRLKQILVNIIGNSIKFTPSGGSVKIAASEEAKLTKSSAMFKIVVTDTGCGMSEEFVKRIFIPFERDEHIDTIAVEGTGLGMTITKNLVDLMSGTITVKSQKGVGTEMSILLPLKIDLDMNAKANAAQCHHANAAGSNNSQSSGEENEPKQEYNFAGKRILVVDDDDLSREMVCEILKDKGASIVEASDGLQGLEAVKTSEIGYFDAVLMDMRMPNMPGDIACREIRSLERPDVVELPVFALTADAYEEGYRRSVEAGMTAHITKPLRAKKLFAILDEYLNS